MKVINVLPVIFVRSLVVFPGMSVTVTIGRDASRRAILEAQENFGNTVVALTQLRAEDSEIKTFDAAYEVGTVCRIEKVVTLTDGGMQVQLEGLERFQGSSIEFEDGITLIRGARLPDKEPASKAELRKLFESLSTYQPVTSDKWAWIQRDDPEELERINSGTARRQAILHEPSAIERIRSLKALE